MQARDRTAIDTDKMRMVTTIGMRRVAQFKPPDMVAQFSPRHQANVHKIVEIAKHCGLIEAQRNQICGDLCMCCR